MEADYACWSGNYLCDCGGDVCDCGYCNSILSKLQQGERSGEVLDLQNPGPVVWSADKGFA